MYATTDTAAQKGKGNHQHTCYMYTHSKKSKSTNSETAPIFVPVRDNQ